MSIYLDLAAGWLRVGVFGFGGGPSVIPLIRAECVDRYHWMDDAQLLDAVAFGNALPGPIAVKLAAHIGMMQAGWVGSVIAVAALSVPGVAMMLALGTIFARYKDHRVVIGMLRGLRPVGVALLVYTVWTLAPDGVRDVRAGVLAIAALGALLLNVHPAIVIAVGMVLGVFVAGGAAQ